MTDPLAPIFNKIDFEILEAKPLNEGFFRLTQYSLKHRLYAGGWTPPLERLLLEHRPAAAVLLYDPKLDKVVLIEQFRVGALKDEKSPWLVEIVAGVFKPDESPEASVVREAMEEAGCEILDLYPISHHWVSPGGTSEYLHIFCGRVDATRAHGFHGLPHENEDIRVIVLPAHEAFAALDHGRIVTAHTIIALQWLELHHEFIRLRWR